MKNLILCTVLISVILLCACQTGYEYLVKDSSAVELICTDKIVSIDILNNNYGVIHSQRATLIFENNKFVDIPVYIQSGIENRSVCSLYKGKGIYVQYILVPEGKK